MVERILFTVITRISPGGIELSSGLTLPITGLRQTAKRAVAIPVDWRVRQHCINYSFTFRKRFQWRTSRLKRLIARENNSGLWIISENVRTWVLSG